MIGITGKKINLKRAALTAAVFLPALSCYILADVILRQNSVRISEDGEHSKGNFGGLVSWLPQDAKIAIEYRARSIYLRNRMNRTPDPDAKVRAVFTFADYIKVRDPKGSDAVMTSIVLRPEFKDSRWAYDGYARLLLDGKSSRPVTVKELHAYLAGLAWPEDQFKAWSAVAVRLGQLRAKPELFFEVMAPVLDNTPPFRNYERFFNDAIRYARNAKEPEKVAEYEKRRLENRKHPYLANALLNADEKYRVRYRELTEAIAQSGTPDEKVSRMTAKAVLTRGMEDAESNRLFDRLLDDPELKNAKTAYQPLASLLLYRKSKRQISIARYHLELKKREKEPVLLLDAWMAGMVQLKELKADAKTRLAYGRPLLEKVPEYRDYSELFRDISASAKECGDAAAEKAAEKYLVRVQETDMPSLLEDGVSGKVKE